MHIYDAEKDDRRFFRLMRRILTLFAVLIAIFLIAMAYFILTNYASSLHGWRYVTCIVLTALALLIYGLHWRKSLHMDWPPPLLYAVSVWISLYIVLLLLTLINVSFVSDFYIIFALSLGLFGGARLLLAVGAMTLTLFAFQDLLVWPFTGQILASMAAQILTLFSITGTCMMFQHLVKERFEHNDLLLQLSQANGELEQTHRQLAQSVIQEQELAVLRERTRLAREMHDTIGHALVLISVKLEAAQRLRERDPERCDQELESTKQVARETMTALRTSIANLRTPALEHEHIDLALSRATEDFARRTNLHATCTFQVDIVDLPEAVEETLWKVSQEAFTNIEKHAYASHMQVRVSQQGEQLLLSIHDDGVGLPPTLCQSQQDGNFAYNIPAGHYGLRGIRERVEAIDGHLRLHSKQGQGTTIEVELPLTTSKTLIGSTNYLSHRN